MSGPAKLADVTHMNENRPAAPRQGLCGAESCASLQHAKRRRRGGGPSEMAGGRFCAASGPHDGGKGKGCALSHSLILLSSAPAGASSPQKGGRPSFPILLASLGRREKGCDESMRQRPAFPACKTSRQAWRGWQGKSPRTVQPPGAFLYPVLLWGFTSLIRKRSESQRLLDAGLHYALAGFPHATCFTGG